MSNNYKIVTRQIAVPANSNMQVEVNCNSFIIRVMSGFCYIDNMMFANGGQDLEVSANANENLKQSLNITTGNSVALIYIFEKRLETYSKNYQLVFTLITKPTNFEVDCLDMQLINNSGMPVYIDNMTLYSGQFLKISANANERIKQTFYITTGGLPETELWIIQRI